MDDKLNRKAAEGDPVPDHHKTLEERIRESGCELSGIGELDWGEPQGNELW